MRIALELLRSLFARLLSPPGPGARRHVVLLVVGLALIPVWQRRFLDAEVPLPLTYANAAPTGVHAEPGFFFFLYHLGLYPLKPVGPVRQDTRAEAERLLRDDARSLVVDEGVTFRSGDRGRVFLYYPSAWIEHDAAHPKVVWGNAIGFWLALGALWAAFWWIRAPGLGAISVVLLGSNPFMLYSTYRQENVLGWPVTAAMFMLALHLPLMTRSPPTRRLVYAVPIAAGVLLATMRTIRSEPMLLAASAFLVYLTVRGADWRKRVTLAAVFAASLFVANRAWSAYFDRKFDQAHAALVANGGTPYTGPRVMFHEIWHPIFCGLGDFDTTKGYKWDDRVAYRYAYDVLTTKYGMTLPEWRPERYTYEAWYDADHKYPIFFFEVPHYHEIIREKVLSDIRTDPRWYLGILTERVERILTQTSPLTVHFEREPWLNPSSLIGPASVLLGIFLAATRRWTKLKILLFTLPLSAPALIVFSGKGMPYLGCYHFFGFAILCALVAEGARRWVAKTEDA